MKELAARRSNCLCRIKHFKQFGIKLTDRQEKILVVDELYRLQSQYFRIYQLGDPATVQATYDKLCKLLDEELQTNAQEDQ